MLRSVFDYWNSSLLLIPTNSYIIHFSNVREDLWNFCFAGYHGLQKWFKDRRQSTISDAEIQHVIAVFNVFDQSEDHMEQLDEVLAEYEII